MKIQTRNLLSALLGTSALVLLGSAPSFALDLPTPLHYDMGPLGDWTVVGGVDAFAAAWNNSPASGLTGGNGGTATLGNGSSKWNGDISLDNAMFIINSKGNMFGDFPLQFHAWVGWPPQSPVIGLTSPNVAPNLYATMGKGKNATGFASPLFKAWATYQPLDWFSIEGGRLPSVDGTEIGVDFLNATPFLSALNNMQTTVADGAQINLISGPDKAFYYGFLPGYGSTLTIRIADGYKTGFANELGFTGLWNLTPDGSDFIVGYGHTRLSTVGGAATIAAGTGGGGNNVNPNSPVGFGTFNSNLIGVGTVYNLTNRLMLNAEVETAWLPQSDIPTADRCGVTGGVSCGPNHQQDYYRWSSQVTLNYDFGIKQMFGQPIRFQWAVQPSFTYQHANTSDPNANQFGNFYGENLGASAVTNGLGTAGNFGTFGAGSKIYAIQTNPTFQFHNFFLRPSIAYTRIASLSPGFGYGGRGTEHDQVVFLVNFGWLLGQQEDTNSGQH
ncbi:MAG: hypothetical protein KGL11_07055 [Alphaproteobacteria bacterium]|nr:hypothetical protein [Alphaproteobacteria bacterium]